MKPFNFNRQLHLDHFAKIDELKESKKAEFYKRQTAGKQAYITVLKKQIKLGNNGK
jgi:hypothetical protein